MTNNIIYIIILSFISSVASSQESVRALFLGNSYTNVNDLPALTRAVALAAGDTLYVDSNTPGGYTFQQHVSNSLSIGKIQQGGWDFVVLQEQSQIPSFPISQVETMCFPYAHQLDSIINSYNGCAETMFYMTWGRKNGDASNCASWPPVCTYYGMDSLLRLRYMMMADGNQAAVSPVGAVWRYIRHQYPGIELYSTDESHPSAAGSYAAALSFYTCFFRKDPLNVPYDYILPAPQAAMIRDAASKVVFDSLSTWNIGNYDPVASFNFNIFPDFQVEFINNSQNAYTYHWDFGDGYFSDLLEPVHQYQGPGLYQVTLSATKCLLSDTLSQAVNVIQTSNDDYVALAGADLVYPNPAGKSLYINNPGKRKIGIISINDLQGKEVLQLGELSENGLVDVSRLMPGVYCLKVFYSSGPSEIYKFVKQ